MAGWKRRNCENRTHRRPPNNVCNGCRSSKRGWRGKVRKTFSAASPMKLKKSSEGADQVAESRSSTGDSTSVACGSECVIPNPMQAGSDISTSVPVTLPVCAQRPEPVLSSLDFGGWSQQLEKLEPVIKDVLGYEIAHSALSTAHGILSKFKAARRPIQLPGNLPSIYALVSVALAVGGRPEEPSRSLWRRHVKLTSKELKRRECLWIMALPFSAEIADTCSIMDMCDA